MKRKNRKITAIGLSLLMLFGTLGNTGITALAEEPESEQDVVLQEINPVEQGVSEEVLEQVPEQIETIAVEADENYSESIGSEEIETETINKEAEVKETDTEETKPEETQEMQTSEELELIQDTALQIEETADSPVVSYAGQVYDINNEKLVINSENKDQFDGSILTGTLENKGVNQFVIDSVEINLTFRSLSIKNAGAYNNCPASGLVLKNGAVLHLTLEETNQIQAGYAGAGITVPSGCTLEITGNSTGSLEASGGGGWSAGAGIGADGRVYKDVGTIIIRGGTIKATGSNSYGYGSVSCGSAGIGGTDVSENGTIQITGGNVEAVGGTYAAGIGGGTNGKVDKIEISGGTIHAVGGSQGSYSGSAIGSGHNSYHAVNSGIKLSCGEIIISNGTIYAEGNIGYGTKLSYSENDGGSVDITGTVQVELVRGEIAPRKAGSSYRYYKTEFQIYDTRLGEESAEHTAVVQFGNQTFQSGLQISEKYTGKLTFGVVDTRGMFSQGTSVKLVDTSANLFWESELSFSEEGEHEIQIGKPFYSVYLYFLDNSISSELPINSLKVTDENGEEYTTANGKLAVNPVILPDEKPETGILHAWLSEGTYNFTIDTGNREWGTDGIVTVQGTVQADSNGTTILAYRGNTTVMQDDMDLTNGDISFGISNGLLTISMTDADGTVKYYENQPWDATYTITTSAVTDHQVRIQIADGYRLNLKLKNVEIDRTGIDYVFSELKGAISLSTAGTVALYLEGENSIKSKLGAVLMETIAYGNRDFLRNCHLIFEKSSGSLFASGGYSTPVIGGYYSAGSIEINGGKIAVEANTTAQAKPAGIGVGYEGEAEIKIRGGVVSAVTNGGNALGIHKPSRSNQTEGSASVEISGGEVTIGNTEESTVIGKTDKNPCDLTVTGGNVIVKQGYIETSTMTVTGGTIYKSDGSEADIRTEVKNGTEENAQTARYTIADVSAIYGKNAEVTSVEGLGDYGFTDVKTDLNGKLHLYLPVEEGNLLSGTFDGITYQGKKEEPVVLSNFFLNVESNSETSADAEFQGIEKDGTIYYQVSDKDVSAEELIKNGTALTLNGKKGTAKLENLTAGEVYTIYATYVVNGKHGGVRKYTFRSESAEPPLVDGYYEISTANQMVWFEEYLRNSENQGTNGKLMSDIDLSGVEWTPMCPDGYKGIFDGNGHVIQNLNVTETISVRNQQMAGFFGRIARNGQVKNLGIENAKIAPPASKKCTYGGVLSAYASSAVIQNCYSSGTITFENVEQSGGIIGLVNVINSWRACAYLYTSYSSLVAETEYGNNDFYQCFFVADEDSYIWLKGTGKTLEQFESGEVAWLLNDQKSSDDVVWRQTLGVSAFPSFRGRIVYHDESASKAYWNQEFKTPTADLFTFIPPENLKQNGEEKEAEVYLKSGITGMGTFNVCYKKVGENSYLKSAPVEAGEYEVWISLLDGTQYNGGELQVGTFTVTEPEIVSVDVTWGDLSFEYQDGKWNPDTYTYSESGWKPKEENGAVVSVTNSGTVDVEVEYKFTGSDDLTEVKNLQGIFVNEKDEKVETLSVLANQTAQQVHLYLSSDKPTAGFDKPIGAVTVVIKN